MCKLHNKFHDIKTVEALKKYTVIKEHYTDTMNKKNRTS